MEGALLAVILFVLLVWIGSIIAGIILWVKGNEKRSKGMVIGGSFLCLGIIGLIITLITTSEWDRVDNNQAYREGYERAMRDRENNSNNEQGA